ncbi:hypothetical protein QUA81_12635 [Microcoleus sp. F6_B4]
MPAVAFNVNYQEAIEFFALPPLNHLIWPKAAAETQYVFYRTYATGTISQVSRNRKPSIVNS